MKVIYNGLSERDRKLRMANLGKLTYPSGKDYIIDKATSARDREYREDMRAKFRESRKKELEDALDKLDYGMFVRGVDCKKGEVVDLSKITDADGLPLTKGDIEKFKALVKVGAFSKAAAAKEKVSAKKAAKK